jgi:transposase
MSHLKHQATTRNPKAVVSCPDPEVVVKGERRQFSPAYKQRIVEEAARCPVGEVGALLRREGLYGSHLSKWRREVAVKEAASRRTNKPFQEKPATEALATRLREVESENALLRAQLMQAEAIMAAQKKLVQSFERCLTPSKPRPSS